MILASGMVAAIPNSWRVMASTDKVSSSRSDQLSNLINPIPKLLPEPLIKLNPFTSDTSLTPFT